jgi:hypothetical protein
MSSKTKGTKAASTEEARYEAIQGEIEECAVILEQGEFQIVGIADVCSRMAVQSGGSRQWCEAWIARTEAEAELVQVATATPAKLFSIPMPS